MRTLLWVLVVVLPGVCGPVAADVVFAPPVVISPSGTAGAGSSEAGDFDNDGRAEFVSADVGGGAHLRVYDFNPGAGSFDIYDVIAPADAAARQNRFGGDLTVADIDGDGWVDLVVPSSDNSGSTGSLSWFENPDGDLGGSWTEHQIDTWSGSGTGDEVAHMSEVDVGDIDGDGRPDVVTRDVSHGVFVLLQESDGSGWRPRRFIPTNPREGLDLFDPDGDGDLDIILNGVWLETPPDPLAGTYTVHPYGPAWYPAGNSADEVRDYASQIAVADFNGDTRDDIAISNSEELNDAASTGGKPLGIQVFLAPADPKTEPWVQTVAEAEHFSWHSLEPADLDGDGAIDFVSAISDVGADNAAPEIAVFLNSGDGTGFTKSPLVTAGIPLVYNATLADADGDGDADLFAPNGFSSGPMRYFENVTGEVVTPPPPTVSLVAHWPLDEESGTSATESRGGHPATLAGSPTWRPGGGQIGGALEFGGDADRATAAPFDLPAGAAGITLAAWVRAGSFTGNASEARFISKATGTGGDDHFWMLGNYGDGSALRFRLKAGGTTTTLVSAEGVLETGSWTHVAATFDGTAMRIYKDGGEVANVAKTGSVDSAPSVPVGLGNQPAGSGDRALDGLLDDVRIYSGALDAAGVQAIMAPAGAASYGTWRDGFGIASGVPDSDDSDGDAQSLLFEYAIGNHPGQPDRFSPQVALDPSGDTVSITFPDLRSDVVYEVSTSSDLVTWSPIGSHVGSGAPGSTATATGSFVPAQFFRLGVALAMP